jgi:hypothetical protein
MDVSKVNKLLSKSGAYYMAAVTWKDGEAHVTIIQDGPLHGVEHCARAVYEDTRETFKDE